MAIKRRSLVTADNLNIAFLSKTSTSPQTVVGPVTFTGDVNVGKIASGDLPWSLVTGKPSVTAGTGLSGGGSLSSSITLSVKYGSNAGTAVEGNKQITVTPQGNITGGGTVTLGSGGTINVGIKSDPEFSMLSIVNLLDGNTAGSENQSLVLRMNSTNDGVGPGLAFSTSTSASHIGAKVTFARNGSNGRGDLIFHVKSNTSSGDTTSEKMRIRYDGNIGIGTDNPTEKLHVNGNLLVTGTINGINISSLNTNFSDHISDTTVHITSAERTNWNAAYSHSQAAHAPSDAPSGAAFAAHTGDTDIHVTTIERSNWNSAYEHSQVAHAPSDAPSGAVFTGHTSNTTVHITSAERTKWNNAYTHATSDGTDHTYIDQDVRTTASPTFAGLTVSGNVRTGNTLTLRDGTAATHAIVLDRSGAGGHSWRIENNSGLLAFYGGSTTATEKRLEFSTAGVATFSNKVVWLGGDSDKANAAYAHSQEEHLTLGTTSTTAYRGDRGKIAYDHSQSAHAPADAPSGSEFLGHTENADIHVTSAEKSNWDAAYTHSQSAHAPADAPSNAVFTGHTGDTTIHITANERTLWNSAVAHANSDHAPVDAPSNADFTEHTENSDIHVTSKQKTQWSAAYAHSQASHAPVDAPSGTTFSSHVSSDLHVTSIERSNWNEAYAHSQEDHAPSDAPSAATFNAHANNTSIHLTSSQKTGLTGGGNTSLHLHDDRYLQLTGGALNGKVTNKKYFVAQEGGYVISYQGVAEDAERIKFDYNGSSGRLDILTFDGTTWTTRLSSPSRNTPSSHDWLINNTYKIWHEGNDGASSGLDADLLDGQHGSHYAKAEDLSDHIGDEANPHKVTATQVGAIKSVAGIENAGGNIEVVGTGNISVTANSTNKRITITGTGSWPNASNADKLDNLDSSQFMRSDIDTSTTGSLTVHGVIHARGPIVTEGAMRNIYDVVSLNSTSPTVVGTCKITMPRTWSNTMARFVIKGYNYNSLGTWEVVLSGYAYSSGQYWTNTSAEIRGKAPFSKVRLAHDGDRCCILLGETDTTWSYPKVYVAEVMASHSNQSTWESNWSIDFITDESSISSINTPTIHFYVDASGHFNTSGDINVGQNIIMKSGGTVDGVDISAFKSDYDNHNHDGVYVKPGDLASAGPVGVHWGNITGIPDPSDSIRSPLTLSKNNASEYRNLRSDYSGYSESVAREDHFHRGLENILGYGVVEGLEVTETSGGPTSSVQINPGIAILADGHRLVVNTPIPVEVLKLLGSTTHSREAIVYLRNYKEYDPSHQFGVESSPDDPSPDLPPLPPNAIPLARVSIDAGMSKDDQITNGRITNIRRYPKARVVRDGDAENFIVYKRYRYNAQDPSSVTERPKAMEINDNDGNMFVYGDVHISGAITTNNKNTAPINLSNEVDDWRDAAIKKHEHIWNDRATPDPSQGSSVTRFYLSNIPAVGKCMVFRNGQLLTEGDDYNISNNVIEFPVGLNPSNEVIIASYEVKE